MKNIHAIKKLAKERAFLYLDEMFEKYSHFPILEYYPNFEEKKYLGWHFRYPSPYLHANVMYALLNSSFEETHNLLQKATPFLLNFKEPGDIWRFWNSGVADHAVFCGTDDTAIASIVLEKLNRKIDNKKILFSCINKGGTINTWITSNFKLLVINPIAWFWLMKQDKPVKKTINLGFLKKEDIDTNITLNTLMYLGINQKTECVQQYIIDVWRKKRSPHFLYYINKTVFAYHIARAYKEGIHGFSVIKESILQYFEDEIDKLEFAELLMGFLSMKYFKFDKSILNEFEHRINKKIKLENDIFIKPFPLITGVNRRYFGGGGCLTAAWFIEFCKYSSQ